MANEFVLDDTTVERLEKFLADPKRPQGTFTFDELLGFLFTVASCPAEIPEDEWMEVVFDGEDPMCQDFEETEFLYEALTGLLEQLEQEAVNNESHLPQRCQARTSTSRMHLAGESKKRCSSFQRSYRPHVGPAAPNWTNTPKERTAPKSRCCSISRIPLWPKPWQTFVMRSRSCLV